MTTAAAEKFETYTAGSNFTNGQALGAAGANWAFAWRTANSHSTGTGTVAATNPLESGQRLNVTLVTQANKSASHGAVGRPYTLTSTVSGFYGYAFTLRPDTAPANLRYQIYETRTRAAGPDGSTTWQIASVNDTWQVFDGSVNGGANAYIDTGMAVIAGTAYDFIVSLDPVARTWAVAIADDTNVVVETGLNCRYTNFATDTTEGIGGRWINFGAQETYTGSATVGVTGTYSLDGILIVMPEP
jgi:hypothetical protein